MKKENQENKERPKEMRVKKWGKWVVEKGEGKETGNKPPHKINIKLI